MTNGRQFRHYVWIVNTLRQRRELTLSELNDLWVRDEVADGNPLPRSSFNKYRDAILVHSVPLTECHPFVCGDDDMDEFFQKDALDYTRYRMGKSYCFRMKDDVQ